MVKAFNDVSAYAMIHADVVADTLRTTVCADDIAALTSVRTFAQVAGFQVGHAACSLGLPVHTMLALLLQLECSGRCTLLPATV